MPIDSVFSIGHNMVICNDDPIRLDDESTGQCLVGFYDHNRRPNMRNDFSPVSRLIFGCGLQQCNQAFAGWFLG
jgi:CobQ-like glutamine amidotransferase family enzyme